MATGDRHDPVLAFCFAVEIGSLQVAGFSEVSGLQAEIEVQEYREGGVNGYVHKRAGPVKYASNLTLKKGITDSTELWSWYRDVMNGRIQRKQVDVVLMNSAGEERRRWKLHNAYPVKWTGPDMKAATSEVAVETLELAHEGLLPQ
jgi:phage tail-like protein